MLVLRNYRRYLMRTKSGYAAWHDLGGRVSARDLENMVKFSCMLEARHFLGRHPRLQKDFKAWIVPVPEELYG